ncbi:MAG: hypothetical protein M5U19_03675 [Microthrixaceae bacterium]|nr:hypothetical protein [Microthrixaceae bacterium]
MAEEQSATIEDYYHEDRRFPPPEAFAADAELNDPAVYERAEADFAGFWADVARDLLDWDEPFHTALEWNLPDAKWFVGGKAQRHLQLPRPSRGGRPR